MSRLLQKNSFRWKYHKVMFFSSTCIKAPESWTAKEKGKGCCESQAGDSGGDTWTKTWTSQKGVKRVFDSQNC